MKLKTKNVQKAKSPKIFRIYYRDVCKICTGNNILSLVIRTEISYKGLIKIDKHLE